MHENLYKLEFKCIQVFFRYMYLNFLAHTKFLFAAENTFLQIFLELEAIHFVKIFSNLLLISIRKNIKHVNLIVKPLTGN